MPKRNDALDPVALVEAEARDADLTYLRALLEAVPYAPFLGRCTLVSFSLVRQLVMIDLVLGWTDAQIEREAPAVARVGLDRLREDATYAEVRQMILARAADLDACDAEPPQALRALADRAVNEVGRLLRAGKPATRLAAAGEVLSRAAPKPTRQRDRAAGLVLLPAGLFDAHRVVTTEMKQIEGGGHDE